MPAEHEVHAFEIRPVYYFSLTFLRSLSLMLFSVVFIAAFCAIFGVFMGIGLPDILGTGGSHDDA